MIEHGLVDSSHYRPKSSVSEDAALVDSVLGCEEFVSVTASDIADATAAAAHQPPSTSEGDKHLLKPPSRTSPESSESDWETLDPSVLEDGGGSSKDVEVNEAGSGVAEALDPQAGMPITVQPQAAGGGAVVQGLVSGLEEDQYGLPLPIFTKVAPQRPMLTLLHMMLPHNCWLNDDKDELTTLVTSALRSQGYLCLPYMALQQHHLLSDVAVRGFVAGATNILFRQQRHLSDAIVDVSPRKTAVQQMTRPASAFLLFPGSH